MTDPVSLLPVETAEAIFSYLSARELAISSMVCLSWRVLTLGDMLWRTLFCKYYGEGAYQRFKLSSKCDNTGWWKRRFGETMRGYQNWGRKFPVTHDLVEPHHLVWTNALYVEGGRIITTGSDRRIIVRNIVDEDLPAHPDKNPHSPYKIVNFSQTSFIIQSNHKQDKVYDIDVCGDMLIATSGGLSAINLWDISDPTRGGLVCRLPNDTSGATRVAFLTKPSPQEALANQPEALWAVYLNTDVGLRHVFLRDTELNEDEEGAMHSLQNFFTFQLFKAFRQMPRSLAVVSRGRDDLPLVVIGGDSGGLFVFDTAAVPGELTAVSHRYGVHRKEIQCIHHAGGQLLLTGGRDGGITLTDLRMSPNHPPAMCIVEAHRDWVWSVHSPEIRIHGNRYFDADLVASGAADDYLRMWSLRMVGGGKTKVLYEKKMPSGVGNVRFFSPKTLLLSHGSVIERVQPPI